MQITTNQNPSPAAFTTALTTNSYFLVAASSAAVGDNNLSSTCSRKQAFVPADPALGGPGAEMGSKKQKRNNLAEYQCRFTRAINLVFVNSVAGAESL
jgi:hypothetical protein